MNKNHVMIIAEAGVNHNGDIRLARQLIDAAAEAGADYVKFQTFKTENLVSKEAKKADYQIKNVQNDEHSQFCMLKKLELSEKMHYELAEYCVRKKIGFLSTAFDEESVNFLDSLRIPFFKIPSGEITNKPYLQLIASKGKPVVMSTGMADMNEIEAAVNLMVSEKMARKNIAILHCNTQYPTPYKDVNLLAMQFIHKHLQIDIGYSDHTLGIEVPIAAVALGAKIIEKHFTIDRNLPGPDHKASLEPAELKAMISAIRNIELAISGDGIKRPSESERPNIVIARKSIHLANSVKQGEVINKKHLMALRPGDGISPMKIDRIAGKVASRDLKQGTKIAWSDLE